ncbi:MULTISPECIES: hypothetical protein [Flagellimonas]|uniref:Lacal_2735 family protein n=1 Tax=Flagellimonas hadalis TaxID=2597517 RepID=A0A5N5J6B9_9FLAO|nr:hypothetical protein [Allomuricauda hadalis]KAB5491530.1 hypothetical protein FOT42_000865 [Allomuricauda hadalis]RUA18403.1 MAG: hypothetical protein DSY83_02420 [Flavobacteriia bacterium]
MFNFFRNSSKKTSLIQLDHLYMNAISKLSVNEKIAYCQRLIESSEYQLAQSCPKKDVPHLKSLITAADEEIHKLRSR